MPVDGPSVLVSGTERNRVGQIASTLAGSTAVKTAVGTDSGRWLDTNVEVVVFADGDSCDISIPEDAARVVIFKDSDDFQGDRPAACDRVLVEPLLPDDLQSAVISLARRVRYDRRLEECAELAARCGRAKSTCDGGESADEHRKLREQVDGVTAELDGLLAEFSSDDFRQAFRTLAAD